MARVLLYERAVDAICTNTHIDLKCEEKTQNGVKIKEEIDEDPVDTTFNTNMIENCINNISQKNNNINNKRNEFIANSHSVYLDDVNKTINLKRKIMETTEKLVCNASSQPKKKRQCSNKISKVGNTSNIECEICFRKFNSVHGYEQHKLYYDNISAFFKCILCKRQYKTRDKLHTHLVKCHRRNNSKSYIHFCCNFCSRNFSEKFLLQSHLFHIHNELIYSSNRVEQLNFGCKNHSSTPQKSTALKIAANQECSNNTIELEDPNISFTNNANKLKNDDLIKTKESKTEASPSHEMSPKKLRQPTLTEYFELYKKKCDKDSSNKLNMKDGSSTFASHRDRQVEESVNPKLLTKDIKVESLSMESSGSTDIPKQMTHSTSEQNEKDHVFAKKPFVKIHADVKMMKTFLDNLPDTVAKDNIDDTSKSILSHRELPYSLRSPRVIPFIQTSLNSRNKSKNVFKTQSNAGRNTETVHNVTDLDFWKTSTVHFKCKDCIIPLTRCDKNPKLDQISTNNTTFKTNVSPTVQSNSTSFREDDIQNKMAFKELKVSLERLEIFSVEDIPQAETKDAKKPNGDCFLCKICNKDFSSKLTKQMHIKSCHIAYMSSICNARYKRKRKLAEHYLQEHLFKLNQCCVCYMIVSNFAALEQHLNIHCIKYVRRNDDQYPIDIDIKCRRNKKVDKLHDKCSHYNEKSSLSNLILNESHCMVQKEAEEERNNSLKETSTSENHKFSDILKEHHNENADETSVVCEENTYSTVLCENPNNDSAEKSNTHQMSVINENSVANDLIVTEGIGTETNESQKATNHESTMLPENDFIITDQDVIKARSDVVESDTKIEQCIICGKQFHSHMELQRHMRTSCHVTDVRSTEFGSKRFLQTQTATHMPQFSKRYTFFCMFCNQGFLKKVELRSHVLLHLHDRKILNNLMHDFQSNYEPNQKESDKLNTMTCNVCHLEYETHDRYAEHLMYYYKNHIFTCSLCKQTFQGMYLFHKHYKLTHYSEDIRKSYSYICEICNEGFKHKLHFHSHKMHIHLNEESSIEIANRFKERNQFDDLSEIPQQKRDFFTNLQKQIEQSSYKYTCQICQMRCANANHLIIHEAFYSNDGHFQCNSCSRRCRTSAQLQQHIKLSHTCRDIYNGHVCDICGEVLETTISLKCHEKHFHSNNVKNANVCKNCGQILSSNMACKKHRCNSSNMSNIQLVGRGYDCSFCDMNFFSASAARMHITQVHIDQLLNKHPVSKSSTIGNIQEQSEQPVASSSENSHSQLLQQSTKIQNCCLKYLEEQKKTKIAIKSSNQVKALEPSSKFKAILSKPSNQIETVLSKPSNQANTVSSKPSNQEKSILLELPNKIKTVLPVSSSQLKTVPFELLNQGKLVLPEPLRQVRAILPKSITKSPNQLKTVQFELNQEKFISPESNKRKLVLFEPSNKVKTILPESSNQIKTAITKSSNQAKTILCKPSHQTKIVKPSNNNEILQQKILCHASPHINGSEVLINSSMAIAPNNVFKTITPVSLVAESTSSFSNEHRRTESNSSSNSGSNNVFQVNQILSLNGSGNKSITPLSSNGLFKVIITPQNMKTKTVDKTVDKKFETINNYICPLCRLVYPSLMFFHAHLKYAHANFICNQPVNAQVHLPNQKIPIIKCLLCPNIFTEEAPYKIHLKYFHTRYMYIPYFAEERVDNANNPVAHTSDNRKNVTPEVITLDDDSIENNSDKRIDKVDAISITRPCKEQNDNKIGKLRVKSFAKIIENLSMESVLKPK